MISPVSAGTTARHRWTSLRGAFRAWLYIMREIASPASSGEMGPSSSFQLAATAAASSGVTARSTSLAVLIDTGGAMR